MPRPAGARRVRAATVLSSFLLAAPLSAGEVQLAPFVGLQFGGHLYSPVYATNFSLKESLDFGATVDLALTERWRLEALYSRQETELRSSSSRAPAFPQTVERYMVGIQEEPETDGRVRFFGVALLGATRLDPGIAGTDSELRFALGLSLGAKVLTSTFVAFRFEARGFYTIVESGGAIFCTNGACLFQFSGSGLWQGDVTASLVFRF
jgi:hypothetical protein